MASQQSAERTVGVYARNVGGIDEAEVALDPGVTVLTGRNATNRTSFLQATMAGLGSDRPTLKGDADDGEVQLAIGDDTHNRTLTRRGDGSVGFAGDPYLDDAEVADQFAFLLENTEVRQAVARGDDLRECIMRPVDTDQIEADIEQLEAEKREIAARVEELEELERELPDLETEQRTIEDDLEESRAELARVEAEIQAHDVTIEESRTQREEIEEAFDAIRDAQSERDDIEFELEVEHQSLAELRSEREEVAAQLEDADGDDENPERLAGRIEELRHRKHALDDTVSQLGSVISFNVEMLDDNGLALDEFDGDSAGAVTDTLVADAGETVCWTCGSEVETSRIDETVDRLRDLRQEKLEERNELRDRIEDLTSTREAIQQRQRERERAERRLTEVEDEIVTTESRIEELETSLADKREEIDRLESETEAVGAGDDYDEVLELHRTSNEVELRIERLEERLADVQDQIAKREATIDERADLVARREQIADELTDLRTRVRRIEEESVEAFNEHMEAVLAVLEYDNLERIWIERREREVREGRTKTSKSTFDLHVVRATEDGTTYRDVVDHLSESEREVTGLVFALAGYLVYEVYEDLPFMILDSLEAIDSDRIARVIEYFSDYVDYLLVALLPEDAQALSEEYTYVEQID